MQAVNATSPTDLINNDKDESKSSEFKLDGGNPDCNLIINYIPTSYTEEDLRKVFIPYGNIVKLKIVRDYITKNSLGYGFVVFQNATDADAATRALNGFTLDGKRLKVSIAKPPQKETEKEWTNLYVSGLPHAFTADNLTKLISQYGVVKECRLLYDPITKSPRGVGFARLDSKENAQKAIKSLAGTIPEGGTSPLQVKFADTPAESAKRRNRSRYGPILQHGGGGPANSTNRFSPMGRGDSYHDRDRYDGDVPTRTSPSGSGSFGFNLMSDRVLQHISSPSSVGSSSMSSQHSQLLSPSSMASPSSMGGSGSSLGSPSSLSASALFLNNNSPSNNHLNFPDLPTGGFNPLLSAYESAYSNLLNHSPFSGYDLPSPTVGGSISTKHSVSSSAGVQSFPGICLFVYHLPPDTTEAALWQLFAQHGTVCSTKVMKDLRTNQSKGFGFVNMLNESDAHAALQALNGYQLGSKHLKVSIKTQK